MSIKVSLSHVTHYQYDKHIRLSPQIIRLKPAPHATANVNSYSMHIEPSKHLINWQQDPFANYLAKVTVPKKTNKFKISINLVVNITSKNPFDFFLEKEALHFPITYQDTLKEQLQPYLQIQENHAYLVDFVHKIKKQTTDTLDQIMHINQQIYQYCKYLVRLEPGVQTVKQTLDKKSGSCRDLAYLLCEVLRYLGFASRFCSGYLIQLKSDDIKSTDGPKEDFCDLHAWTEVFLPGAGWIGLDPTSALLAAEGHIALSCTPNPADSAPVSGEIEECEATLYHEMSVVRLNEHPLQTPYTPQQWQSLQACGAQVFASLRKKNCHLSIGGEPTFVSHLQRELPEWQLQATGEHKQQTAKKLLNVLAKDFAPHGLFTHGQGKWYPGELLPRWAYCYYWRKDGEPITNNINTFTYEYNPNPNLHKLENVLQNIACKLNINPGHVISGYEDPVYALWQQQKLPVSGNPKFNSNYEKNEMMRIKSIMQHGLNNASGFILPLTYDSYNKAWLSNQWSFYHDVCILKPGDSLIGYRLPLDSLPYVNTNWSFNQASTASLSSYTKIKEQYDLLKNNNPPFSNLTMGSVRTALCVEYWQNCICFFIPPLCLEAYLQLIHVIEVVLQQHNCHAIIAGYTPYGSDALQKLSLTPDPGVLEINIPPTEKWEDIVATQKNIYYKCAELDLHSYKFLRNGQMVGSGGGNHIVIGSLDLRNNPFMQRPHLLRKLITFWQHHPSLSYLFSSLFIGPTSQSPRIDESRREYCQELELAFLELANQKTCHASKLDWLFRHYLADLTGNTHRSEISIDKFYPFNNPELQLGLVELRGFEMQPHYQMNTVPILLVSSLINVLWDTQIENKFIPWGDSLHDKYLLPHFLWQDLQQVCNFLANHGVNLDLQWFKPCLDFRCPVLGKVTIADITLELRMALELWPVIGEEQFQGTVARAVDSSTERVQVCLRGPLPPHYQLRCNGFVVPIHQAWPNDTYIAGVKYKAWSPTSALHPLIPAEHSLIFEIFDTHNNITLGGCTYYIAHPTGRSYSRLPINENEACGRRMARFLAEGFCPYPSYKQPQYPDNVPYTFDLRQARLS